MVEYTVKRSSRKTMGIYVTPTGVEVRAPYSISQKRIDWFVRKNEEWIKEKSIKQIERTADKKKLELNYGSKINVLGKEYTITEKPGDMVGYNDDDFFMPNGLGNKGIISACKQIYRLIARGIVIGKVVEYSMKVKITPLVVKISDAKKRWGSCSKGKSLNFAWRLMLADDYTLDYVVVHELAHIKEMNHSKAFWDIVEQAMPDYRDREKKLKDIQVRLEKEGWMDDI